MLAAHLPSPPPVPTGPGYSVVLILHVACVAITVVAAVVSGSSGVRLAMTAEGTVPAEALRRYYAPGANWAARAVHGVPVFGFVLLAQAHGRYDVDEMWVAWGLALWVLAAVGTEALLLPGESRIRGLLAGDAPASGARRLGRRSAAVSIALLALMAIGSALMVAKP